MHKVIGNRALFLVGVRDGFVKHSGRGKAPLRICMKTISTDFLNQG